jgi:signal transduction histidine kinase/ActR/RegA family two-component response regulator
MVLVRVSGRISSGSDDRQQMVEGIAEDVTQQHLVEEHLRQSDRMEALGRLASGVAHDFNNILLGVTLNLEHAIARIEPTDNVLREELEQALHAARSAASVTHQLLVFGRRRSLQLQHISLNEVVTRSQNLVKQMAGEKTHVNVNLGPEVGKVRADPVEIQQVILNLAVNARDAISEGGQITIKTASLELKEAPADEYFMASPPAGSYVVLEMSDTGSGIAKGTLSHVFEPFFTTKEEGSGLGLSTSYGIVAESGGYMSIRTELGRGTTVRAYLPRVGDFLPHAAEMTEARASLFTSCEHTVLVVADTDAMRNAISRDLQQHGYFVLSACNSADALRMSRRHPGAIDLLLTDIVRPGIDGRELAMLLLNERPSMKVIYISGDDRAASGDDAAHEFHQPLLYKPFSSHELVSSVANVLQAKTA